MQYPQLFQKLKEFNNANHRFTSVTDSNTLKKLFKNILEPTCWLWKEKINHPKIKYTSPTLTEDDKKTEEEGYNNEIKQIDLWFEDCKVMVGAIIEGETIFVLWWW
jgi:hypothetical protein